MKHGPISKILWESLPTKLLVIGRTVVVLRSLAFFQCQITISNNSCGFWPTSYVLCSWWWVGDWCLRL